MESSQDRPPEDPTTRSRPRVSLVKGLILALAIILVALLLGYSGELSRRASFYFAGSVRSEGLTWFLNRDDKVITQMILDKGTYEPETTDAIRDLLQPGDTFIDVGANIGWFTLIASREVGDSGRVIAFEPDPVSFDLLRRNVEKNKCENVLLEEKALSNERGELTLFIHDTNKGSHSLFQSDKRTQSVKVEAFPLDEYLQDSQADIALIKIDTEGAEGLVLAGMLKTIETHNRMAIVMEFTPSVLRETGTDPAQMMSKLFESNYDLFVIDSPSGDLVPVERDQLSKLINMLEEGGKHVNVLLRRAASQK